MGAINWTAGEMVRPASKAIVKCGKIAAARKAAKKAVRISLVTMVFRGDKCMIFDANKLAKERGCRTGFDLFRATKKPDKFNARLFFRTGEPIILARCCQAQIWDMSNISFRTYD